MYTNQVRSESRYLCG